MNNHRSVSMEKTLSEPEFARAVSDSLPQLVAMAKRLTTDEEMAAEAVQNALLKASKSWRKFRGESQLSTWLTRIVIHAVRDLISAEQRRTERVSVYPTDDLEDQQDSKIDACQDPSKKVLEEEKRLAIRDAVRRLPHRQREVFSLIIWQGMSARDVGQLLDIEPSNVHANMHAARKRLREILTHYLHDDRDQ